jgi:hypothetical protein
MKPAGAFSRAERGHGALPDKYKSEGRPGLGEEAARLQMSAAVSSLDCSLDCDAMSSLASEDQQVLNMIGR